jgi:hypothetical protein
MLYYESTWLKIEIAHQYLWNSLVLNLNKISETVYGVHGSPFVAFRKLDFVMG